MLRTFLVDGPATTSKSTLTGDIVTHLQEQGMDVVPGDAGSHYRKVTELARRAMGATGLALPPAEALSDTVYKVLAGGVAYEPDYPWGDLESAGITAWVSTVADLPHMKADASGWYRKTADGALQRGADALVINGRAPRAVLQAERWFTDNDQPLTMELFAECALDVAAQRVLTKKGLPHTPENIIAQIARLDKRRTDDAQHKQFPCLPPERAIEFPMRSVVSPDLGRVANSAIVASHGLSAEWGQPVPIVFDTGTMFDTGPLSPEAMKLAATTLVDASIAYSDVLARVM